MIAAGSLETDVFADLFKGSPVELRCDHLQGRHVVASRDLVLDEIVVAAIPFASTTFASATIKCVPPRQRWCAGCLRFRQHKALPMRCIACGISFCSPKCKSHALELGIHTQLECCALSSLSTTCENTLSQQDLASAALLVSIATRASAELQSINAREPSMRHVSALATCPDRLPFQPTHNCEHEEEQWKVECARQDAEAVCVIGAAAAALRVAGFVESPNFGIMLDLTGAGYGLKHTLLTLHSQVSCNSFGLSSDLEDGAEVRMLEGWGVFPAASLFNHSCLPNLYIQCGGKASDRGSLTFRVMRAVTKGSPLTISYGKSCGRQSMVSRRATFRNTWHFVCSCERCLGAVAQMGSDDNADEFVAFDQQFHCNGCGSVGPSRSAASDKGARPRGCSCLAARNRLAG